MGFHIKCFSCLLFLACLITSEQGHAQQKRKLTPVTASPKIAYINIIRVHTDYQAFKTSMEHIWLQWQSGQTEFNYNKEQLGKKLKLQLDSDSLQGGVRKTEIEAKGRQAHDSLVNLWRKKQQDLMNTRTRNALAFEKKIDDAVQKVFKEGAFTVIKTFTSETSPVDGTDITALVLQKLQ